jgi:hypothetical protein
MSSSTPVGLGDEVAGEAGDEADDRVEPGPVVVRLVEEQVGADPHCRRERDGEGDFDRGLGDVTRTDVVEEEGGERGEDDEPHHAAGCEPRRSRLLLHSLGDRCRGRDRGGGGGLVFDGHASPPSANVVPTRH